MLLEDDHDTHTRKRGYYFPLIFSLQAAEAGEFQNTIKSQCFDFF